jgi:hypothetical protein
MDSPKVNVLICVCIKTSTSRLLTTLPQVCRSTVGHKHVRGYFETNICK